MSTSERLLKQGSHYFTGMVLTCLAGFISFPVLTRIFSTHDYGILSITTSTLFFLVAFTKMGLQNAAIRFYGDFDSGKRPGGAPVFYSTLFFGALLLSGVVTFLFFLITRLAIWYAEDTFLFRLLSFVSVLVYFRTLISLLMSFNRAEQKTACFNTLMVLQRYSSLGLSILFALYLIGGLYGLFYGFILSEGILLLFLIHYRFRQGTLSLRKVSFGFLGECVQYGFPLLAFEMAHILLAYGDRYLLKIFLDAGAVGRYSAGYNLAMYASELIVVPLALAAPPLYLEAWAKKGEQQTRYFLGEAMRYYLAITIPLAVGMMVLGKDVMAVLAPSRYAGSHVVIPYVLAGTLIYGTYPVVGAGLYIYKKTYILTGIIFLSGALNVVLNILFIPRLGIMGAALSTLVSYGVLIGLVILFSFRHLSFAISSLPLIKYAAAAILMGSCVRLFSFPSSVLTLLARAGLGAVLYSGLILLLDKKVRMLAWEGLRTLRGHSSEPMAQSVPAPDERSSPTGH